MHREVLQDVSIPIHLNCKIGWMDEWMAGLLNVTGELPQQ